MLVLSRKVRERIILEIPPSTAWRTITVDVSEFVADKVRLAFDADKDVNIGRKEVFESKEPRP